MSYVLFKDYYKYIDTVAGLESVDVQFAVHWSTYYLYWKLV
jgi:hypothetical protein